MRLLKTLKLGLSGLCKKRFIGLNAWLGSLETTETTQCNVELSLKSEIEIDKDILTRGGKSNRNI